MERKNLLSYAINALLFIFLFVGVYIYTVNPDLFHKTTPYVLSIFAIVAIFYAPKWQYIPIFVITFLIEALGVATGFPFGNYYYTERLGPMLLATPLLIGINWVWVSIGAKQIALLTKLDNKWLLALISGLVVVIFDILLEPVAIMLEWWVWPDGVGLANYAAWFIIGGVASLFIKEEQKEIFIGFLLMQVLFFIALLVI